jgi:uncharacterized protein YndB with AHSA1/START domain
MTENNQNATGDIVDDTYGELEGGDGQPVVRFRRRFTHGPEKVWRAVSEPDHLEAWFPTTIEGEPVAGAVLRFSFRENEAPPFEGEMVAFDPPTSMEFRWGEDRLRFELHPDGGGTVLDFTVRLGELGKAARDGAGWHACLDLLECDVARRTPPWTNPERWRQVRHAYIQRFGPEASRLGPPPEWEEVHGPATS